MNDIQCLKHTKWDCTTSHYPLFPSPTPPKKTLDTTKRQEIKISADQLISGIILGEYRRPTRRGTNAN